VGCLQSHDVDTKFCEKLSADSKMYRHKHCVLVSLMSLGKGSRENGEYEYISCDILGIM